MPDFNDNRGEDRVGSRLARSGLVTASILALVFVLLGVVWGAHKRGRIHKLTEATPPPASPPPVRPGGQDIVRLTRLDRADVITPEFTSATLLPGLGAEIVQAVINPESSTGVPLLDGSSEEELSTPQAKLHGAPFSVKVGPPDGARDGETKELVEGKASKEQSNDVLPDGDSLTAKFNDAPPTTVSGPLPPSVEATVTTTISSRGLEVRLSAKNVGSSARAITLAWSPRFLLPQGGLPVRVLPPPMDSDEASGRRGAAQVLTGRDFDVTYQNLRYSYLSAGSETILENMGEGYALRLTALTPTVRTIHVQAAKGGKSVLVGFSSAGPGAPETVAPGESVQWRIRVEAIPNSALPHTLTP